MGFGVPSGALHGDALQENIEHFRDYTPSFSLNHILLMKRYECCSLCIWFLKSLTSALILGISFYFKCIAAGRAWQLFKVLWLKLLSLAFKRYLSSSAAPYQPYQPYGGDMSSKRQLPLSTYWEFLWAVVEIGKAGKTKGSLPISHLRRRLICKRVAHFLCNCHKADIRGVPPFHLFVHFCSQH